MKSLLCLFLLCLVVPLFAKHTLKQDTVLKKLAFGSCNKNDKTNHLWDEISKFDPQLWMWLGDIVYADNIWRSATIHDIRQKYALQKNITGYKNLIAKTPEVLGVWDDHDFGKNNGGKEYHSRWESQRVFLDFIDEPQDSPRWKQEGVYASYTFGPKGKQVKIIMLDTRYHRDDQWFGDILGEDQWKWFEQELKSSSAQITIITSGIQILPAEKPIQEKWNNFPSSYSRLMDIIRENKVGGVLFFSGDVHYGEVFKRDCSGNRGVGYPLYEITSSGMTHSCKHQIPFGICELALEHVMKSKYRYGDVYTDYNYGTLQIDWDSNPVMIHAQVRGVNGTALTLSVSLNDLQPGASKGEDCSWEHKIADWRRWRFYVFQTSAGILGALGMTIGFSLLTCCLKRTIKPKRAQLSTNYLEKKSE